MSDRELLEKAAKFAGIDDDLFWSPMHDCFFWAAKYDSDSEYQDDAVWNPLERDGDALHLAALLRLKVILDDTYTFAEWKREPGLLHGVAIPIRTDKAAALRRAIVDAAVRGGQPASMREDPLQEWISKGEAAMAASKRSALFRLGEWWADRPWRKAK